MIELYLMRHGIAADLGEAGVVKDADRPLTPEGREKMKLAAVGLRKAGMKFNLILTSPLLRSRQTAEVVADALELQHKVRTIDSDRAFVERAAARFDHRADLTDDRFYPGPHLVPIRRTIEEFLKDRPRGDDQRDRDCQKDQRLRGEAADAEHCYDRGG